MSRSENFDPVAAAERQAAIAELMARLDAQKQRLARVIANKGFSDQELQAARELNASTNSYLAQLWEQFFGLEPAAQVKALADVRFHGQHWQSLMQANPYALTETWRAAP